VPDERQQVVTVDRAVTEPGTQPEPVRVQAATADLHHLAVPAPRRQSVGADLPGDRGRVVEGVVEAVGRHIQAGVGGTWIG